MRTKQITQLKYGQSSDQIARLVERHPVQKKAAESIPGQGTDQSYRFHLFGMHLRQPIDVSLCHIYVFSPFSFAL